MLPSRTVRLRVAVELSVPSARRLQLRVDDTRAVYPVVIDDATPATAHTRLESDQAGAEMGEYVAGAGDVNGDGYADVIVGAWRYDAGEADEGAAFVFHGSATGIANGTPATAQHDEPNEGREQTAKRVQTGGGTAAHHAAAHGSGAALRATRTAGQATCRALRWPLENLGF